MEIENNEDENGEEIDDGDDKNEVAGQQTGS